MSSRFFNFLPSRTYDDNQEPDAAPLTSTSMGCRWKDVGIVVIALAIGLAIAVVVAVIVIEAVGTQSQPSVNGTAAIDARRVAQKATAVDSWTQLDASDGLRVRGKRSASFLRPFPSTKLSREDERCDSGWTYSEVSQRCYKFIRTAKSWHGAEADCKLYGGYLAIIHSEEENEWIVDFSDRHWGRGELTAWIGLNNLRRAGWQWIEGSPLKYDNWASNEPNNAHENCANIYVNYPGWLDKKWNDFVCDWNLSSICEKSAGSENFF